MPIIKVLVIVMLVVLNISTIASIDEPREPISKNHAVLYTVLTIIAVALIFHFWN